MLPDPSTQANRLDREVLHALVAPRLAPVEHYTLFFSSGAGRLLPGLDVEEATGYVLDATGRLWYYHLGWDADAGAPALLQWRPTTAAPDWAQDAEYQRARARLGLE